MIRKPYSLIADEEHAIRDRWIIPITTAQLHAKFFFVLVRVCSRDNKFAVYNKDGDVIASGSTRTLGNAVKNACLAIDKDLQSNAPRTTTADN